MVISFSSRPRTGCPCVRLFQRCTCWFCGRFVLQSTTNWLSLCPFVPEVHMLVLWSFRSPVDHKLGILYSILAVFHLHRHSPQHNFLQPLAEFVASLECALFPSHAPFSLCCRLIPSSLLQAPLTLLFLPGCL